MQATKAGAPPSCVPDDLIDKESAVKFALPPEDWPLSVSTVDVTKIPLRVNMSKAAEPDNIPGYVLIKCATESILLLTFFTHHCHRRVFPPGSRQPPL